MILKAVACSAVFGGCGYLGIELANRSEKRMKQLREFRRALNLLEFDVDFLCMPICESFDKIAKNCDGVVKSVFSSIRDSAGSSPCGDMWTYWERAFELYRRELYISEDDKKILKDFAKNLGAGDRDKEMNNIRAADARLKIAEEEAYVQSKKDSKMYRGLGFLSGIFLVIVLV